MPDKNRRHQQARPGQRTPAKGTPLAQPAPAAANPKASEQPRKACTEHSEEGKPQRNPTDPEHSLVRVTWVLAVANIVLVIIGVSALWETRAQFFQQQRPYVWLANEAPLIIYKDRPIRTDVVLQNFGQTPALHVRGTVAFKMYTESEVTDGYSRENDAIADAKGEEGLRDGAPAVGPGERVHFAGDRITSDGKAIEYLEDMPWAWVAAGIITYEDLWGQHYVTKFCLRDPGGQGTNGAGRYCKQFNEMK